MGDVSNIRRVLLVEDGFQRGALAAARSFGRAGWAVGVAAPAGGWAVASRYVRHRHRIRRPRDGIGFVQDVAEAIGRGRYDLVFPVGDAETLALSAHRSQLAAVLPYPPHDVVARALDKVAVAEAASACGVPTPQRFELGRDEVLHPVVVKERVRSAATRRWAAYVAATPAEARARAALIEAAGSTPLLEELLVGPLVGYAALVRPDGGIVADVQQVADRTWPPRAGGSTRAEIVSVDPQLAAGAAALLRELRWCGLVQLQYVGGDDGVPRLIDLNGRFYGSLALAVAAGVDFPLLWAAQALGPPLPRVAGRPGRTRYQWLEGDLRRALVERRRGLALDVLDSLRYAPGAVHATWSARDPAPALAVASLLARRGARKALRRYFRARNSDASAK
jgi:predicted ATP-grasp superfamily ATP-dependent carboligase